MSTKEYNWYTGHFLYPRLLGILDSSWRLYVQLSLRPPVNQISGTFLKIFFWLNSISETLFTYVFLLSILDLWWPNICPEMGVSPMFSINYLLYSFDNRMEWVYWTPIDFGVVSIDFGAIWWPNICPKIGFPECLKISAEYVQHILFSSHMYI